LEWPIKYLVNIGHPKVASKVRFKVGGIQGDQGPMLLSQFSAIFDNFRRKKLAFFSKTNVIRKLLQKLAVVKGKNANFFANFFAKFFGENIFNIVTSVPDEFVKNTPKM
jgi:hypothetical protein